MSRRWSAACSTRARWRCSSLEPQLLTEAELADDQAVASAVVATLVAAGRQLLADPALQNRYTPGWLDGVPDADLFSVPAGYPDPIVFGRLDGVRTPEGLRVLEFNGGLPGGILPADASAALMAGTDIAEQFGQRHPFRTMTAGDAVLDAMVRTWHDFGARRCRTRWSRCPASSRRSRRRRSPT